MKKSASVAQSVERRIPNPEGARSIRAWRAITFFVPVKTQTESNTTGHWRPKAKRAKRQREAAFWSARQHHPPTPDQFPLVVRMTRVGAGTLDDDNLQSAMKHLRDGIADWLGVDDRRLDLVTWEYAQERGSLIGVRVSVARRSA